MDSGELKLHKKENVIIFDKAQAPAGSISAEGKLVNSDETGLMPTKRGRNRAKRERGLSRSDALGILQSVVRKCQEAGFAIALTNLPSNPSSFGIVFKDAWCCERCGTFFSGNKNPNALCGPCLTKLES